MQPDSPMVRCAFSLGIAAYAVAWGGVLVWGYRVFGIGLVIVLSLIFVFPFVIALRMRCRWPAVRRREIAFLFVLLIFVLGGSGFTIWHWYDIGMDIRHAKNMKFDELTRLVHEDPAVGNIELYVDSYKCLYWISGTVASQADLDRLKSLGDQYGFLHYMGVEVADRPKPANEQ